MTISKMYATYLRYSDRTKGVFFITITLFQSASVQFFYLKWIYCFTSLQPLLTRTNLIKPWRVESVLATY